ncbi:hypothetical protein [Actinomadura harenae]|uniref:Uncharacterized protein n=1 Tax=Actinomadura harenae TaxID=2483351 RepID=A0A3M2LX55_9ACTN|nr:hypothetical protein [Actinomadura harenae]RMI41490.1 hypothetical protein EBO15_22955 [Actinomadura harenae]
MSIRRRQEADSRFGRAQVTFRQGMAAWRDGASTARERMGPAAQQSREIAAERMLAFRAWSAPRLRVAAKYVESDLGPKVSTALTETAHRIEPRRPARRARSVMVALLAGVMAACVAGVLLTRRNAAQNAHMMTDESASEPADSRPVDQVPSHTK